MELTVFYLKKKEVKITIVANNGKATTYKCHSRAAELVLIMECSAIEFSVS